MTSLRGTMLTPGVSANRRLYTPELIQKAYTRLSERIKSGLSPVTMLTYHEAGDNSREIVGRITGVALVDGKLDYTAELADTAEAATIAKLVTAPNQFLRGVSIRGRWVGEPRTQTYEGQLVTTADDMEVDGLDFTKNPGVLGAFVAPADSEATEAAPGASELIYETVEARAVITEVANTKPYGSVRYADPGYQSDKVKRYPLDTKTHAKAAWSYINQADNAKKYTAAQLKRIRARIKSALQKFGVNVATEADNAMPQSLTEAATTLSEYYPVDGPDGVAGFCISAYNGPLTVSVSAYSGVDPADLPDVAMAAMSAACDAIKALDPDMDGDIDTGAESAPEVEAAPASDNHTNEESNMGDTTPEAAPAVEEHDDTEAVAPVEEAAPEEAPAAEPAESDAPITRADLAAAVQEAVSAALRPPSDAAEAAATEESAESPDEDALRESIRAEVIREAQQSGLITRKGLVEKMGDGEPEKPLHEMDDDEFRRYTQERSGLFFAHDPQ